MTAAELLGALHLASPALPVGGFAYSQGLESAIALGLVADEAGAARWIGDLLEHVLARTDAPVWLRAYDAARESDLGALERLDRELFAIRETAELRAETSQMASSLLRVLPALGCPPLPALQTYPAAFAAACAALGLAREAGLAAYFWSWLENQVLVVLKCAPLGQLAGQRLLHGAKPALERALAIAAALAAEDPDAWPPAACAVAFARACAAHEVQYSRLFRS